MRHYTPEERARLVSDWRSSGMTRKAFANQHGVSPTTLSMWHKRIDAPASPAKFHPVVVAAPEPSPLKVNEDPVAEVMFGALTVRIYAGIADSTLSALLNTFRRDLAC